VNNNSDELVLKSKQAFRVDAPQIFLPAGSVYSIYPPQGHSDTVDILPHVVLNDPHLPWERVASTEAGKDATRNKVPWLALLTFTQDELRVPATVLATAFDGKTQSDTTLAIPATGSDINGWGKDGQLIISPLTTTQPTTMVAHLVSIEGRRGHGSARRGAIHCPVFVAQLDVHFAACWLAHAN